MAVSTGSIATLANEVENRVVATPYVTLNSNAKTVAADPDNPDADNGASHIILTLLPADSGRKARYLDLREKWTGATKTTGAVVTVYGRFKDSTGALTVWRELYKPDLSASSINFGTTVQMEIGSNKYSPSFRVDLAGAHEVQVLVTTASNAAGTSIIEGNLFGN